MSDEQQGGMEPEAIVRGRPFTEDTPPGPEPAEDTEGHSVRGRQAEQGGMEPEAAAKVRPFTEDTVPGPDPAEDAEGHGWKIKGAKDDEELGSETGPETSDDDDTEAHRQSLYSDRHLKRVITPVSW